MKVLVASLIIFALCAGFAFAGPKVFIVKNDSEADYSVYITKNSSGEKNTAILKDAKLVKNESESNFTIFITQYEGMADIVITQEHFPK